MDIITIILLFLGGCVGGLLAGLLGVGGGLVFVIIFTNYLASSGAPDITFAHLIVSNSMFAIFFAGISGSVKHYINGNFSWRPVLVTGSSAALFSILTTVLINTGNWYSKELFAFIFILLAGYMAYRILFMKEADTVEKGSEEFSVQKFLLIGSLGGILAAVSGVGGGIIMVPMLTKMLKINIKKATAISLGVITIMSLVISAYSFFASAEAIDLPHTYGLIILPMALPVVLGCVVCSPYGVMLARRIPAKTIQAIFAVFLLIVVSDMIYNLWL
ncbi:MAG TPA: sulfite exporter TauE/SafE family protein [Sphingobacteriaceae bacterium]